MNYKNLGIFVLLLVIVVATTLINGSFADPNNIKSLVRDTALFGLISIGVAFVIITGGIDLSIGSLVALSGVVLVQFISLGYSNSDFTTTVAEVRTTAVAPLTRPALRLEQMPTALKDGDRLAYDGMSGQAFVTVQRITEVDEVAWVEIRDQLQLLRKGIPVKLQQLTHRNVWLGCVVVLLMATGIGLMHGLMITKGNLQPFVVTLCGLLVYRGLARVLTADDQIGFGSSLTEFKDALTGPAFQFPIPGIAGLAAKEKAVDVPWLTWIDFPVPGIVLLAVALAAWFFLNRTVYGRHLLALGNNERAARFSGIQTERLTIMSYMVCSATAGLAGILFTLDLNSVQPGSTGTFYELYAIAAAVLGGCSLRGGTGAVVGVIVGTAVMRCLYKAIVVLGIAQQWEMVIIGIALLAGVVFDEVVRRMTLRRRLKSQ